MLFNKSASNPITGGKTAPPIIAITKNEAAILVSFTIELRLKLKIVGYMADKKKLVATNVHTASSCDSIIVSSKRHIPLIA